MSEKVERKTVNKSLRLTEDVASYIEKYPGNKFSEKFDNMIEFFREEENELRAKINSLRFWIDMNEKQLKETEEYIKNIMDAYELAKEFKEISDGLAQSVTVLLEKNRKVDPPDSFSADRIPFGSDTI